MNEYSPAHLRDWMDRSIALSTRSESKESGIKPLVGVVMIKDGEILGESYRGETGEGRHAEFGLIERLGKDKLAGATVFTTLEPCSRRNEPKKPCAQHLIEAKVDAVFIGAYDPNPKIYREGWRMLRDAGIKLRDYYADLRMEINRSNATFVDSFRSAQALSGTKTFDYNQNAGSFTLEHAGLLFETRWTQRGRDSIYAIDHGRHVALARYAKEFNEIDDPGALDWSNYTVDVTVGEIVAFRNGDSYALVRVSNVAGGPSMGADHTALTIDYELRPE